MYYLWFETDKTITGTDSNYKKMLKNAGTKEISKLYNHDLEHIFKISNLKEKILFLTREMLPNGYINLLSSLDAYVNHSGIGWHVCGKILYSIWLYDEKNECLHSIWNFLPFTRTNYIRL